jgi:eukaryotic-like serine/threonine-protein kinase
MSHVDWDQVADVFADALEQPIEHRRAFVAARCSGAPEVRAAVERLLEVEAAAGPAFLERRDAHASAQSPGTTADDGILGVYRLVREIGLGGMGQVFLAERVDGQFEQRVAVKLVKRGMDSEAILARFLRERQILASLNHPNIARLLDGGIAHDGRPYFVMEHVDGTPITRYCDERRLSIDDRLNLFRAVCRAVEHAHRNLVLHRDLKPSNIFVTEDGIPKLLDFGIAKLLSAEGDAEATTLTQAGAHVLTPEYAAPEQFSGAGVTTSTDVYGLGAVLYELLAGHAPFVVRGKGERPTRRPEEEPPRLSVALALRIGESSVREQDAMAAAVADARGTDPARLRRRVKGDLETIVATALRAEPDRRYASIEALREDIRRHQAQLPVTARPDTAVYRASRFVRRHRIGVLATATIATLVLTFGTVAVLQANRIGMQAADLELERDRARTEAAAAEEVSSFLVGLFEVSDPLLEGQGDSIRARDLLERGADRIDAELSGQPELQARMLTVIGRAYANLRLRNRAEPLLERALALRRSVHGEESAWVVAALQELAGVQARNGRHAAAETHLRRAIAIHERIGGDAMTAWTLSVDLVHVLHGRGDPQGAGMALNEAWARFDRVSDTDLDHSRDALRRWTELLSFMPKSADVDRVFARLVEVERSLSGPRSSALAAAYARWADAREWRGEYAAADSMLRLAYAIEHERDSTSAATALLLGQLATVWMMADEHDRADPLYRAAIPLLVASLGAESRPVAQARAHLARTLLERGRAAEAIPLYDLAIASYRQHGADAAVTIAVAEWKLARSFHEAGRTDDAATTFLSSLRALDARFPPDYLITVQVRCDYGRLLVDLGRHAEAEPMLRTAGDVLARRWGESDGRAALARIAQVRALTGLGRHDEAQALLASVLSSLDPSRGAGDPSTRRVLDALDALERGNLRR